MIFFFLFWVLNCAFHFQMNFLFCNCLTRKQCQSLLHLARIWDILLPFFFNYYFFATSVECLLSTWWHFPSSQSQQSRPFAFLVLDLAFFLAPKNASLPQKIYPKEFQSFPTVCQFSYISVSKQNEVFWLVQVSMLSSNQPWLQSVDHHTSEL